jgi:hypothetical protein
LCHLGTIKKAFKKYLEDQKPDEEDEDEDEDESEERVSEKEKVTRKPPTHTVISDDGDSERDDDSNLPPTKKSQARLDEIHGVNRTPDKALPDADPSAKVPIKSIFVDEGSDKNSDSDDDDLIQVPPKSLTPNIKTPQRQLSFKSTSTCDTSHKSGGSKSSGSKAAKKKRKFLQTKIATKPRKKKKVDVVDDGCFEMSDLTSDSEFVLYFLVLKYVSHFININDRTRRHSGCS